jgi:[FeFe] hydrogenase H-cluster maturation GTPase HydF
MPSEALRARLAEAQVPLVLTVASRGDGIDELRAELVRAAPEDFVNPPSILADLVGPGEPVILVVPIDQEAPKGRLILPQVQALRDLLDAGAISVVVREHELAAALAGLSRPPRLVVTDSQAFRLVDSATPPGVLLTSFSILFARFQGDLAEMVRGVRAVDRLRAGERVLVAEACTHHPTGEDIGRVKLPRWLRERAGVPLEFETVQGRDFPEDLSPYALVVHCGSCMGNRREMLSRTLRCRAASVPITNYGLAIAFSLGILERALGPFPDALEAFRAARAEAVPVEVPS